MNCEISDDKEDIIAASLLHSTHVTLSWNHDDDCDWNPQVAIKCQVQDVFTKTIVWKCKTQCEVHL